MPCKNCLVLELQFEMKLRGDRNLAAIDMVINYLTRNEMSVKRQQGILIIKESSMKEFLDFCRDHLDIEEIQCRVEGEKEWKSVEEIEKILHMQWIDEVIKKELIICHSQPIVDRELNIYGYELLSRFKAEDGSTLYPGEVFTAARERGRLYALDRICRLNAVKYSAQLNTRAFINFIPTSIYSPEFCLRSTTELANSLNIDPTQFIFEVVESDKVEDIEHLKAILAYYRERGFQYALDDVGAGYSTLEMLTDLKPQFMKLDLYYVQGIANDVEKQQVAKVFLQRAFEVGAVPLAEGIETMEDFEWLRNSGYQLFQGYLFGKPSEEPQLEIAVR